MEKRTNSPVESDAGGRLQGRITIAGLPPPIGNRDKSETLAGVSSQKEDLMASE